MKKIFGWLLLVVVAILSAAVTNIPYSPSYGFALVSGYTVVCVILMSSAFVLIVDLGGKKTTKKDLVYKACAEYVKGCSNVENGDPRECSECTSAFIRKIVGLMKG